jgi:hypothetical protein
MYIAAFPGRVHVPRITPPPSCCHLRRSTRSQHIGWLQPSIALDFRFRPKEEPDLKTALLDPHLCSSSSRKTCRVLHATDGRPHLRHRKMVSTRPTLEPACHLRSDMIFKISQTKRYESNPRLEVAPTVITSHITHISPSVHAASQHTIARPRFSPPQSLPPPSNKPPQPGPYFPTRTTNQLFPANSNPK